MDNKNLVNVALYNSKKINKSFEKLGDIAYLDIIGSDHINTDTLIVGENIRFSPNIKLTWDNISEEVIGDIQEEFDNNRFVWLGSLDHFPENPKSNDMFYHEIDLKSYIWFGNRWNVVAQDGIVGPQGIPGPKGDKGDIGDDGQSLYTWIKYANDDSGNGMSDSPLGKSYVGIAYNKISPTKSNNKNDYTWSKLEGDRGPDGAQGPKGPQGDDGQSLYTWIKYADTSTGIGMSDSPSGKSYIGIAYNKTSPTKSNVASNYAWSLIEGPQGPKGDKGNTGDYYAPSWIKSTYIDFSQVASPYIRANNATIIGTLTGGTLEGTQIKQISSNGTLIADLYKDSYGGKLVINNTSGGTCISMGSESGLHNNRNGTLVLYDGTVGKQRVALGIRNDTGFGIVNIKDNNEKNRTAINSIESFSDPHMVMFAPNGTTGNIAIKGEGTTWFNGGNVAIGKSTASYNLDVQGSARISGSLIVGSSNVASSENGTFTPKLYDVSYNSLVANYSALNSGRYVRVGDLVYISMCVSVTYIMHYDNTVLYVGGLPFSPFREAMLTVGRSIGIDYSSALPIAYMYFHLFTGGTGRIAIVSGDGSYNAVDIDYVKSLGSGFTIYISGCYER